MPIPKSGPHDAWVVDTGGPKAEAAMVSVAVAALAEKPWPWFIPAAPAPRKAAESMKRRPGS
jgi:hypothetical protein